MLRGKKGVVKAAYGEESGVRESPVKLKIWDFVAKGGMEEAKISYGTGILVRKDFALNGKTFYMEIIYSTKFGDLAENEIVVSIIDTAKFLQSPK
jgi:hypothetical protein